MRATALLLSCLLLTPQVSYSSSAALRQTSSTPGQFVLQDGTQIKLRISQNFSSAKAHVNDKVEFEVLEEIRIADILVIS